MGWGGRGPAKHARLAFGFSFLFFFQQAAGKRGQEDTTAKSASEAEGDGKWRYSFALFPWTGAQ